MFFEVQKVTYLSVFIGKGWRRKNQGENVKCDNLKCTDAHLVHLLNKPVQIWQRFGHMFLPHSS